MNHSLATADRITHLKIVVSALIWSMAMAGFVIAVR